VSIELELDGHHGSGGPSVNLEAGLAVARDPQDARILEDPRVEPRGLLGLIVEPKARLDSL
jgi:hypothetical protein